ncbi:uncharacterized protein LOC109990733 [Xyrichtys novacula]|uniref:Uncharacterized protein LOC109990733 n=1 Tax=Xyrichtys novacula TaxID=13765 RepID=A0AAV1G2Y4_XYRNO|nr:uncharacterized protein LOC109990733 [Xyrichtys novacula]
MQSCKQKKRCEDSLSSLHDIDPTADTMLRFSLIICVSLIVSINAKPYQPLNKFEEFRDTVMSVDKDGKMSWGVEVEPPEDLDETHYDVDPSMKIWKSMVGGGGNQQYMEAEVDLDELYHPSVVDLLKVQIQNTDVLPAEDVPVQLVKAEEDTDEVAPEEPEPDMDAIYHKAREELAVYLAPLMAKDQADVEMPALYLEPEEDLDDLYHQDILQPVPLQDDAQAAALVDLPFQGKYSEPEEDLDDFYHK